MKAGILPGQDRIEEGYSDLLVSKGDLEYFESAYFMPAKVASQLSTVAVHLIKLLIAEGGSRAPARKRTAVVNTYSGRLI